MPPIKLVQPVGNDPTSTVFQTVANPPQLRLHKLFSITHYNILMLMCQDVFGGG